MKSFILFAILVLTSISVSASTLYRVTQLRAAPGNFSDLIEEVKKYKSNKNGQVSVMRHSQGDHWDLMLLEPAGENPTTMQDFNALADFQQSFLAKSDTEWKEIKFQTDSNTTYHIEVFHAVHGKAEELLKERSMENAYLAATQQTTNIIFETTFGSDIDSFTIGYHKDLNAFATTPNLPKAKFEQAAKDAGFKNRADLSFYLRSLIVKHQDTLATPL